MCAQMTMEKYPDYPSVNSSREVKEFAIEVNSQLALYRGKKGIFARSWVCDAAASMPAYMWWDNYGSNAPHLQECARIITAQCASASIVERVNSEFAFVKDRKRNRLSHGKADRLVSLFHNLRLLKNMKKTAYTEPSVGWSEDENKSGITKFGINNY